jgi:putative Mn2+ efflux pump MntP
MNILVLLMIAVALSADAFAVAIVVGMTLPVITRHHYFRLSFHFGFFQAAMFATGWLFGSAIHNVVGRFDRWLAFALLCSVGIHSIHESRRPDRRSAVDPTAGWQLVLLSVATSLDALAVGFSLGILNTGVTLAAIIIGITTAALTLLGIVMGHRLGQLWGHRIEAVGGYLLVALGVILLAGYV